MVALCHAGLIGVYSALQCCAVDPPCGSVGDGTDLHGVCQDAPVQGVAMLQISSRGRLSALTVEEVEDDTMPQRPEERQGQHQPKPAKQPEGEEVPPGQQGQQGPPAPFAHALITGVIGNQTTPNFYRQEPGVGGWGGICTCPDGLRYEVGDNMNTCASLACDGGHAGSCKKHVYIRKSSRGMRVTCQYDSQENIYQREVGVGMWGGSCTCPDGKVYEVGDYMNHCKSLACVGGVAGECHRHTGSTSFGMKAICASRTSSKRAAAKPERPASAAPSEPTSAEPPIDPVLEDYIHDGPSKHLPE